MEKFAKNIFMIILSVMFATCAFALNVPALKGYVNDYANILSKDQLDKLSRDLQLYESATSNQIFFLTIPSLEGEALEEFLIKVAEAWKAGQKDKDNGVIVLLAMKEHKIRIEVGRGLEGRLTDGVSGRIIREEMAPRMEKGDNAGALNACFQKIQLAIKGEYKGDGKTAGSTKGKDDNKLEAALAIFVIVCTIAGCIHEIVGGVTGAIVAPILGVFFYKVTLPLILILIVVGFLGGLIARFLPIFGGGGGGFGGGGGSFGGGGASGSW